MLVRALLLLWVVYASSAMFVGASAVTMVVIRHDLTTHVADANGIIGFNTLGVGIGMVGLITSHHFLQTSKKIKTILIKAKMIDAEVIYSGNDMKRNYYLEHIIADMSRVIKDLVILENSIRKYLDNCLPMDWQTVRYLADRSRKQISKVEQEVVLDFAQILDLVHNTSLVDRNRTNNLYYSLYLCQEIIRIDPKHEERLLRNLTKALRGEIAQLDEIQVLLENERENWQVRGR